ncbi:MAG: hypothetical protein ACIAXF_09280 [Phycisphaerales bacterium JB063]
MAILGVAFGFMFFRGIGGVFQSGPERNGKTSSPIIVNPASVDLGIRYHTEPIYADFTVFNPTSESIELRDTACCGIKAVWLNSATIQPGEAATLRLIYQGRPGNVDRRVAIEGNGVVFPVRLSVQARMGVRFFPEVPAFLVDNDSHTGEIVSVVLRSDDGVPFRIESASTDSEYVQVIRYDSGSVSLNHELVIRTLASPNPIETFSFQIQTTHPQSSLVEVGGVLRTIGDLAISPNRIQWSPEGHATHVLIHSRTGNAINLEIVSCPDGAQIECVTNDSTAWMLSLVISDPAALEQCNSPVVVSIDGYEAKIPVVALLPND